MRRTRATTRKKESSSAQLPGGVFEEPDHPEKLLSDTRLEYKPSKSRGMKSDDKELCKGLDVNGPVYMATEEQARSARLQLERRLVRMREIQEEIQDIHRERTETLDNIAAEMEPLLEAATRAKEEYLRKLKEEETRIEQLQSQREGRMANVTSRFEKVINELKGKHDKISSAAFTHRSVFAPIRRLPPETLGLIFGYVVSGGCDPKSLVFVCHSWSIAALGTHSLWSRIAITSNWRSEEQAIASLHAALTRAGQYSPLDILINFHIGSDRMQRNSLFMSQIDIVSAHATRWRSLHLESLEVSVEAIGGHILPMPNLRSLTLALWTVQQRQVLELLKEIGDTANHLSTFVTVGQLPKGEIGTKLVRNVTLFQSSRVPADCSLVHHMPRLEESVIEIDTYFRPLEDVLLRVPRLQINSIDVGRLFSRSFERIESLLLKGCHFRSKRGIETLNIPKYRIVIPTLRTLAVIGGNHQIITSIYAQNLDSLEIRDHDLMESSPNSALERIWSSVAGTKINKAVNPRVLKIDLHVSSTVLLKVLRRLPQLGELFITERWDDWKLSSSFLNGIAQSLTSSKSSSFSELKKFVVYSSMKRCRSELPEVFEVVEQACFHPNSSLTFAACIPNHGWVSEYYDEETSEVEE